MYLQLEDLAYTSIDPPATSTDGATRITDVTNELQTPSSGQTNDTVPATSSGGNLPNDLYTVTSPCSDVPDDLFNEVRVSGLPCSNCVKDFHVEVKKFIE